MLFRDRVDCRAVPARDEGADQGPTRLPVRLTTPLSDPRPLIKVAND